MDRSPELERALRRRLYKQGAQTALRVVSGLGIAADRVLPFEETDEVMAQFLLRWSVASDTARCWPGDQRQLVQDHLDRLAGVVGSRPVVWLMRVDEQQVGVEVIADLPLRAATVYVVSGAADLMLCSQDSEHGVCVEINRADRGHEYEVVAWGDFGV